MKLLILSLVIVMSVDSSKVASRFVRISLDTQRTLARKVQVAVVGKSVYLFDEVNYFGDAVDQTVAGVRVKVKEDKYAVLSVAAQGAFKTSNTYRQFTTNVTAIELDELGVKLV